MTGYDDLRAQALELFPPLRAAARRADAVEADRRLDSAQQRLEESKLTVVVCGEFKRGKSTLLNALLEEPGLFPVDLSYATSLVTAVTYGPVERVTIRLASTPADEPGKPQERTISRDKLADYVTEGGNPGNGRRALGAVIELPEDRLASGLTLVDTPGIGGVYTEHATATGAVLPTADVIMFVADATRPLTSSELRFLRHAADAAGVRDDPGALICVLTMKDKVTNSGEILSSTRAKLAAATGWPRIPVVLVSSLVKLDSHDEAHLAYSGFPELEGLLWDTLSRRRAKAILGGALECLDTCADALIRPIAAEVAALHAGDADDAAAFRDVLEARQRRLAGLGVGAATWRGDLTRESEKIAREVSARTASTAKRAQADLTDALDDDALLYDTDALLRRLDDDVSMIMGTADWMLNERAARLQRELAGRLGLDLGHAGIRRLPAAPVAVLRDEDSGPENDSSPEKPPGRPADRLSGASMLSIGSTVGSVLGRLLEFFVAPGAGALIGGAVGAGAGVLLGGVVGLAHGRAGGSAGRQPRRERRQAVQADVDQFYRQLDEHIGPAVSTAMADFADAISADIVSRIRQEAASAEAAARRAEATAPADAERAAEREAALNAERAPLDEVRRRVAALSTATLELTGDDWS